MPLERDREIATRETWKALPPGPMALFAYEAAFPDVEYDAIRHGLIPHDMEDKWFIFWEADTLHLHRSWTGACVYQIAFRATPSGAEVAQASVAAGGEHYRRRSDGEEAALVDFLIRGLLLHQAVPFPVPAECAGRYPPGAYQANITGTGAPERTIPIPQVPVMGTDAPDRAIPSPGESWLSRVKRALGL